MDRSSDIMHMLAVIERKIDEIMHRLQEKDVDCDFCNGKCKCMLRQKKGE